MRRTQQSSRNSPLQKHHRRQGKPKAERGTFHSSTILSLVPDPWHPEIVILSLVAVNLSTPIESLHCPCVLSVDAPVPALATPDLFTYQDEPSTLPTAAIVSSLDPDLRRSQYG